MHYLSREKLQLQNSSSKSIKGHSDRSQKIIIRKCESISIEIEIEYPAVALLSKYCIVYAGDAIKRVPKSANANLLLSRYCIWSGTK